MEEKTFIINRFVEREKERIQYNLYLLVPRFSNFPDRSEI